jgi:hypothetical protein
MVAHDASSMGTSPPCGQEASPAADIPTPCGEEVRKMRRQIVSKSKEMVDLTMALFARFWVNGNQDELLSLLG